MNKVITVNLNGNAYQLEESGYDALRSYLEGATRRLENNPDKDEIVADIERAIADKFRAVLGAHKSVVVTNEVTSIIAEMGPVQDDSTSADEAAGNPAGASGTGNEAKSKCTSASAGEAADDNGPARRLYKIPEGAMVAGVCNGIAAYFGLDVVLVRLVFVLFGVVMGPMGLLVHWLFLIPFIVYGVLAIALPCARTPAERTAARGDPATAEEYIRRAKQGYYEGVKTFTNSATRKEWKRKFKHEMKANVYRWKHYGHYDWSRNPTRTLAPSFALPFIGLFEFLLVVVWLFALFSLITKGTVLGLSIPAGIPLWVSIVALVFAFHVVVWPLKAMRHACFAGIMGGRYRSCQGGFLDSLVWLAAVVAGIWLADHYIPQVHEFILAIPAKVDLAAESVKQWWEKR